MLLRMSFATYKMRFAADLSSKMGVLLFQKMHGHMPMVAEAEHV